MKQDEELKRRLGNSGRKYYADQDFSMAHVLELVVEIARNDARSELLQSHKTMLDYVAAFQKDPDLLILVGDAFKRGSYKDVRCLGMSFCLPLERIRLFTSFGPRISP